MPSERQNMSEQDISIKAREHELYAQSLPESNVKPFPVYLRETPGEPLSPATKFVLAIAGIVVALLFVAAVWRATHPRAAKLKTRAARPAARSARLVDPRARGAVADVGLESPTYPLDPRAPAATPSSVRFTARSQGALSTASLWSRDAFLLPVSYGLFIDTESHR